MYLHLNHVFLDTDRSRQEVAWHNGVVVTYYIFETFDGRRFINAIYQCDSSQLPFVTLCQRDFQSIRSTHVFSRRLFSDYWSQSKLLFCSKLLFRSILLLLSKLLFCPKLLFVQNYFLSKITFWSRVTFWQKVTLLRSILEEEKYLFSRELFWNARTVLENKDSS